jgi:hypothetical protein
MRSLRRLQIRPENNASRHGYILTLALYIALGVPLVLLNILGPSTVHPTGSIVSLLLFTVLDFRVLRRLATRKAGS